MSNNLVHWKADRCSFVGWVLKRKRQNNNTLILCYGETGSGKTYATIRKAWECDNTLDVRQIVFSFTEMMEVINSDWFKDKPVKQIVYEEAQVSMNSRTWQSMVNRIINHLLSTFRATQVIVWFTTPYKDFLDSQSMKLIHCTLETRGINRNTNKCRVKLSLEQYNSSMGKYYHHPLIVKRNGMYNKLRELSVSLPPKELVELYEQKKKAFNDKTNMDILNMAREIENKEKPKKEETVKIDTRKPLTDKQENVLRLLAKYSGITKDVSANSNLSNEIIYFHQGQARKKGYSWKEFKENTPKEAIFQGNEVLE